MFCEVGWLSESEVWTSEVTGVERGSAKSGCSAVGARRTESNESSTRDLRGPRPVSFAVELEAMLSRPSLDGDSVSNDSSVLRAEAQSNGRPIPQLFRARIFGRCSCESPLVSGCCVERDSWRRGECQVSTQRVKRGIAVFLKSTKAGIAILEYSHFRASA